MNNTNYPRNGPSGTGSDWKVPFLDLDSRCDDYEWFPAALRKPLMVSPRLHGFKHEVFKFLARNRLRLPIKVRIGGDRAIPCGGMVRNRRPEADQSEGIGIGSALQYCRNEPHPKGWSARQWFSPESDDRYITAGHLCGLPSHLRRLSCPTRVARNVRNGKPGCSLA